MRIDEIDLFGPIYINGLIGTEGQVIGFSGSQISWITASGSGSQGPDGPIGPTGSGTLRLGNNQIGIGFAVSGGLTSSAGFTFNSTGPVFKSNASNTAGGSFVAVLTGTGSTIAGSSYAYSSIIAGCCHTLNQSYGFIGGGDKNCIQNVGINNTILGGNCNSVSNSYRSSIIGGKCNLINGPIYNTNNSVILGGYKNVIGDCNENSIIVSGLSHSTFCSCNSGIIGGCNNRISGLLGSLNSSFIIGGCNSLINCNNSVIIGGRGNSYAKSDGSVVLGGCDLQVPIIGGNSYTTIVQKSVIKENMKLSLYTNTTTPPIIQNGSLFYQCEIGKPPYFVFYNSGTRHKICLI